MYDTITWGDIARMESDEEYICEECGVREACIGDDLCQECRDDAYLTMAEARLYDEDIYGGWDA